MDKNNLEIQTAEELLNADYPSTEAIIPGICRTGCYLLCGAPKVGKSYLALQFAMHIATGTSIWGINVHQGNVLYMALEDTYERLQKRYALMSDYTGTDNLKFCIQAPLLCNGLIDVIKDCCKSNKYKLIIIDTLQMIRNNHTKISYSNDYDVIAKIRDLAIDLHLTVILVHHTRKMDDDDQFATISGTYGLLGAADGGLVLEKPKRSNKEANLHCTGRDIEDKVYSLHFDPVKCVWDCTGISTTNSDQPKDEFLEEINRIVKQHGGRWVGTPTALYRELNDEDFAINRISLRLRINTDRLRDDYNIKYIYKHLKERTIILKYIENREDDSNECGDDSNES